jgi:hypothetical protein
VTDRSIQRIDQEAVTAREGFSPQANLIGKVDRLLVDDELLKGESHRAAQKQKERGESRE